MDFRILKTRSDNAFKLGGDLALWLILMVILWRSRGISPTSWTDTEDYLKVANLLLEGRIFDTVTAFRGQSLPIVIFLSLFFHLSFIACAAIFNFLGCVYCNHMSFRLGHSFGVLTSLVLILLASSKIQVASLDVLLTESVALGCISFMVGAIFSLISSLLNALEEANYSRILPSVISFVAAFIFLSCLKYSFSLPLFPIVFLALMIASLFLAMIVRKSWEFIKPVVILSCVALISVGAARAIHRPPDGNMASLHVSWFFRLANTSEYLQKKAAREKHPEEKHRLIGLRNTIVERISECNGRQVCFRDDEAAPLFRSVYTSDLDGIRELTQNALRRIAINLYEGQSARFYFDLPGQPQFYGNRIPFGHNLISKLGPLFLWLFVICYFGVHINWISNVLNLKHCSFRDLIVAFFLMAFANGALVLSVFLSLAGLCGWEHNRVELPGILVLYIFSSFAIHGVYLVYQRCKAAISRSVCVSLYSNDRSQIA